MASISRDENSNVIFSTPTSPQAPTAGHYSSSSSLLDSNDSINATVIVKNQEDESTVENSIIDSGSGDACRKPNKDAFKLFVGQIPKFWDEQKCRELLEPFGEIYQLNILRDKESQESRGCCFVTYFTRKSALDAQNELHNLVKLPSCRNPIQMKPADNENKNDRKLFIGKLPKTVTESEILSTFSSHGDIEECLILRDAAGQSRGCAFVTFSTRSSASAAVRALDQTEVLDSGCPIVVKFADSKKQDANNKTGAVEQQQLQQQQQQQQLFSAPQSALRSRTSSVMSSSGGLNCFVSQPVTPTHSFPPQLSNTMASVQSYLPLLDPTLAAVSPYCRPLSGGNPAAVAPAPDPASYATYSSLLDSKRWALLGAQVNKMPLLQNPIISNTDAWTLTQLGYGNVAAAAAAAVANAAAASGYVGGAQSAHLPVGGMHPLQPVQRYLPGKQSEGPEGANLFIYHLPAEYGDADLIGIFSRFGRIISAKVFIDKISNLSKCFGFVSFDNAESAQNAIKTMNGAQVLNKRLKVQLKKVRDKPY